MRNLVSLEAQTLQAPLRMSISALGAVVLATTVASSPVTTVPATVSPPAGDHAGIHYREVFWGQGGALHHRLVPFEGDRVLEGPAVYEALGRSDLAERYRTRDTLRKAAVGASVVVLLAGSVVGAVLLATNKPGCDPPPPVVSPFTPPPSCHDGRPELGIGVLAGSFVGGLAMIGAAAATRSDPVSDEDLAKLIDSHNAATAREPKVGVFASPTGVGLAFSSTY